MSTRTLRILTWLLVAAITAIAFAVSFEAISQHAVAVGAFPRSLRYCAPLLVDAFTVAAYLAAWPDVRGGPGPNRPSHRRDPAPVDSGAGGRQSGIRSAASASRPSPYGVACGEP